MTLLAPTKPVDCTVRRELDFFAFRLSVLIVIGRASPLEVCQGAHNMLPAVVHLVSVMDGKTYLKERDMWVSCWDSINGKKPGLSWADNPTVARIEFRRVEVPHG